MKLLTRSEELVLLTSSLTASTGEGRGRHKRVCQLMPKGCNTLIRIREVEQGMWSGVTRLALEGGRDEPA